MIFRVQKRGTPYVMIDKRPLEDTRLSWKARGLLAYLLSKPDSWVVVFNHLVTQAPDGRDSCRSAIRELERAGYIRKVRRTDSTGKVTGWEYVVYELPQTENPSLDNPPAEEPQTENPFLGTPSSEKPETGNPFVDEMQTEIEQTARETGNPASPETENPFLGNPLSGEPEAENPFVDKMQTETAQTTRATGDAQADFPQTENPTLVINELNEEKIKVFQLQGDATRAPPAEKPTRIKKPPRPRKPPRYTTRPVEAWTAHDLLAYVVDEARRRNKLLVTPKNGMGGHLKSLLLKAQAIYDGKAAVAVKALIDECLDRPDMHGTGYLLHEAERFWMRWRVPAEDITAETW